MKRIFVNELNEVKDTDGFLKSPVLSSEIKNYQLILMVQLEMIFQMKNHGA